MFKRLFGGIQMTWVRTVLFSVAVGVFCGIFGGLPALANTSFTDMAGGYEWWVIWAVIICVGSRTWWDAGLKCGTFFLITQPLQFFIQALLYSHNYANAARYFVIWLPVIAATFAGGALAYFAKAENAFGAVVLGLGNSIQGVMAVSYFVRLLKEAPRHLLAFVAAAGSIFVMTFALQKKKMNRLIALGLPFVITVSLVILTYALGRSLG